MRREFVFNWMGYHIEVEQVKHRGFGIIRPDQSVAYHQWMIGIWWCIGIRIIKRIDTDTPRWL